MALFGERNFWLAITNFASKCNETKRACLPACRHVCCTLCLRFTKKRKPVQALYVGVQKQPMNSWSPCMHCGLDILYRWTEDTNASWGRLRLTRNTLCLPELCLCTWRDSFVLVCPRSNLLCHFPSPQFGLRIIMCIYNLHSCIYICVFMFVYLYMNVWYTCIHPHMYGNMYTLAYALWEKTVHDMYTYMSHDTYIGSSRDVLVNTNVYM
jgi:hypothetical protein